MIESEVSILRRVHHPNIVQLVAEYDTHSELYLVMELIKVSTITAALCSHCWLNIHALDLD
jgi:serine/threonine protein kinase